MMHRPGPGYRPGAWFGPRPPVIVERNFYGGPSSGAAFAFGLLGGAALTAPLWVPPLVSPPPVVVAPPVVVSSAPAVVVQQPTVISAPAPVATVDPLDGVSLAAQRLQSHYPGSRREAAETLGRLGDPRGVPPLIDALKNDWFKEVRIAAAHALGEIGSPEAEAALERAVVYEKKEGVRDAAAVALNMAREKQAVLQASPPVETVVSSTVVEAPRMAARSTSTSAPRRAVPPPPAPGVHKPLQWKVKTDDAPALEAPVED
jgi:hypothetical protein